MQPSTSSSSTSPTPRNANVGHFRRALVVAGGIFAIAIVSGAVWLRPNADQTPPASSAPAASSSSPETIAPRQEMLVIPTVYLVRDQANADYLRSVVNGLNSIRAQQGLAPIFDEVVVVTTDEEAVNFIQAMELGNGMNQGLRTIVDLRAN